MQETGNNLKNTSSKSIRFISDGFYLFEGNQKPEFHLIKNTDQLNEHQLGSVLSTALNSTDNLNVYFPSNCFTVVPSLFFHKDRISDILTFDQGQLPANNVILSEKNIEFDYTIIYTLPFSVYNSVKSFCKNTHFHFLSNTFQSFTSSTSLQIWIKEDNSIFRVTKENKLLLFNSLSAKSEEDLLFYILKISEDFSFNLNELKIDIYQPNQLLREDAFIPYLNNCNFISQEEVI